MRGQVAGRVHGLGAAEVDARVRRVVGDRRTLLGLERFPGLTTGEVRAVVARTWRWSPDAGRPHVSIDPELTLAGSACSTRRGLPAAYEPVVELATRALAPHVGEHLQH